MNLQQELTFRASLGFDFLLRKIIRPTHWIDLYDQEQKPHNHGNWTYYLSTISLMLTASKLLGRNDLENAATQEFEKILLHSFTAGSRMFLLKPKEKISQAQWNALCAIILLKFGQTEKAQKFMRSALVGLHMFEHAKTEHEHMPVHLGILILALLQMQKATGENYDEPLVEATELLLSSPANLHGPDVWALYFRNVGMDKLKTTADLLGESEEWLTTPMLALAQQIDMIRDKPDTVKMRWKCLFANQIDSQISGYDESFFGGFVGSQAHKQIRLDYVVDATRCFFQHLNFADKENLLELSC